MLKKQKEIINAIKNWNNNRNINLEDYFASKQIDCAKYLTDDEFETLQGLHKKVALMKNKATADMEFKDCVSSYKKGDGACEKCEDKSFCEERTAVKGEEKNV